MPVFPLRPAPSSHAPHYSPYSPSRFHIDKRCQHRCSWKCLSIALILLAVALTAMLAYFAGKTCSYFFLDVYVLLYIYMCECKTAEIPPFKTRKCFFLLWRSRYFHLLDPTSLTPLFRQLFCPCLMYGKPLHSNNVIIYYFADSAVLYLVSVSIWYVTVWIFSNKSFPKDNVTE